MSRAHKWNLGFPEIRKFRLKYSMMHILHIFCGDSDTIQPEIPVTQHTVWIKSRALPKTNKYLLQKSLCSNTYLTSYCTLQALRSSRSMIQLHCQKPPLWQVTLLPRGYETRALTLSEICWILFPLSSFSQVRATQKCVNDSPDVTVLFRKITKVFSLNRTDTNLPTISYQDPSALAFSDIFQKWVSFKPSLDRSFPAGKGLQCWQLCSGLGSGQLNQDHCHISHSYPKST